jgi:hypothetical protein
MKPGEYGKLLPASRDVKARAGELAQAAKGVFDLWEQDGEGMDPELGAGGICQDIASAMVESLSAMGVEHALSVHASVGENHVFVVAMFEDGVFAIDIPPHVYEIGSGYVWKKREDAVFDASSVTFDRIGDRMDPDDFERAFTD